MDLKKIVKVLAEKTKEDGDEYAIIICKEDGKFIPIGPIKGEHGTVSVPRRSRLEELCPRDMKPVGVIHTHRYTPELSLNDILYSVLEKMDVCACTVENGKLECRCSGKELKKILGD